MRVVTGLGGNGGGSDGGDSEDEDKITVGCGPLL